MSRYTQRVEALENNEKKRKRIFTVIIILLVLIFLGGMVIGARQILGTEGTYDPYAETATEPIAVDESQQSLIDSLSTAFIEADNPDSVRLSVYTDVDIPDDSIKVASGDESLVTELKYIKTGILTSVKEYYKIYEGKFGENFSDKTIPMAFTVPDIKSAECVRGKLGDDGALTELDSLFYTVVFPEQPFDGVESTALYNSFGMDISEQIRDMFIRDISEIAFVKNFEITCSDFKITAQTNKETGRINNVSYSRGYSVDLLVEFKGDLGGLSEQEISFDFTAVESHWYTWAGLELKKHQISIEKGDVEAVEAFKTADDEVTVTWTSSAPEIAEVDGRGYIKGKSVSTQPVTITAAFDYRGKTYTDTCTVYVRKPVTEIKVSERNLTLAAGDTAKLSVEIKPSKATIKDVLWFTEDENVASVDSGGTVTAIGEGTVKVYAISADGYYRSSCVVTVTQ